MNLTNKIINSQARMMLVTDDMSIDFDTICFYNANKVIIAANNNWSSTFITGASLGNISSNWKRKISLSMKNPYLCRTSTGNKMLMVPYEFFTLENFRYEILVKNYGTYLSAHAVRKVYVKELGVAFEEKVRLLDMCLVDYRGKIQSMLHQISECDCTNLDFAQEILDKAKDLQEKREQMRQKLLHYTLNDFFAACNGGLPEAGFIYLSPDFKVTKEEYDKINPKEIETIQMDIPDEKLEDWSLVL